MFSTFLAWTIFVVSTMTVLAFAWDVIHKGFFETENDRRLRAALGQQYTYWNGKVAFTFLVWVVSGIYLFG